MTALAEGGPGTPADEPPEAAAMAMPLPRPRVNTNAVSTTRVTKPSVKRPRDLVPSPAR